MELGCINDEMESEESKTVLGVLHIRNDRGLHTRPSAELVKCAVKFKSEIILSLQQKEANARSLLNILMLAATKGSMIEIKATGPDAEQAVEALEALAKNNFYIHY